jgi:hypothetical protein
MGGIVRVDCIFTYMEYVAMLNVKMATKSGKNQKKIGMSGDNIGWCFQGPLYISIYERCGNAKCKNREKINKKNRDDW